MVEIYLVYLFISAVEILRSRNEIHSAKAAIKYSEQAQIWKEIGNTSNHSTALFLFLWCDQKCSNLRAVKRTQYLNSLLQMGRLYRDVSYPFSSFDRKPPTYQSFDWKPPTTTVGILTGI